MTTATHALDHYAARAHEAVEATRDPMMIRWNDDELGWTRAAILGGEHQDPMHRANLEAALELLSEHVEAGTVEDGTVGRSGATWLTFLSVEAFDAEGEVTQAWRDTVDRVLDPLEDYGVLDEELYSRLEYEELVETVQYAAGDEGLADVLLDRLEASHPDEYDHDAAVASLAWDVVTGQEVLPDPEVAYALAREARNAARHARWDAERGFRGNPVTLRTRAVVLEAIADQLDPEDGQDVPRPYCA